MSELCGIIFFPGMSGKFLYHLFGFYGISDKTYLVYMYIVRNERGYMSYQIANTKKFTKCECCCNGSNSNV